MGLLVRLISPLSSLLGLLFRGIVVNFLSLRILCLFRFLLPIFLCCFLGWLLGFLCLVRFFALARDSPPHIWVLVYGPLLIAPVSYLPLWLSRSAGMYGIGERLEHARLPDAAE